MTAIQLNRDSEDSAVQTIADRTAEIRRQVGIKINQFRNFG